MSKCAFCSCKHLYCRIWYFNLEEEKYFVQDICSLCWTAIYSSKRYKIQHCELLEFKSKKVIK